MSEEKKIVDSPSIKMNLVIEGIDDEKNVIDGEIYVIDIYRFHRIFNSIFMIDVEKDTPFTKQDFWKEKPYAVYLIINLPEQDPIAAIVKDIYIAKEARKEAIGIVCIIEAEPFNQKGLPTDLSRKDFPLFSNDEISPIMKQLEEYFKFIPKKSQEKEVK